LKNEENYLVFCEMFVTCLLVLKGENITRSLSRHSSVSTVSISTRAECFVKRIATSIDKPHIEGFLKEKKWEKKFNFKN